MTVVYTTDIAAVTAGDLEGFFADWPVPPTPERHLDVLRGSDFVVLGREGDGGRVVGFVTAISDGVLSAFIPLLEMLPSTAATGSAASSSAACWRNSKPWRWSTWSATPSSYRSTAASS